MLHAETNSSSETIEHRMGKASKAYWQLKQVWRAPLSLRVKGQMYTSLVRSILLYGAGTWTTTNADLRQLETFEMSRIRDILRISRTRHISSIKLWAKLGIDVSIGEEVRRARLRSFGHVMQMDEGRTAKVVVEESFEGFSSGRGTPTKTWIQCVKEDIGTRGYGLYSAKRRAIKNETAYHKRVVLGIRQ